MLRRRCWCLGSCWGVERGAADAGFGEVVVEGEVEEEDLAGWVFLADFLTMVLVKT